MRYTASFSRWKVSDLIAGRKHDRAERADRGRFRRRRQAEQDRAKHRQDQYRERKERGQQRPEHLRERDVALEFFRLRRQARIDQHPHDHIDDIEARQHEAGKKGGGVKLHHGNRRRGAVKDQQHARRNHDAEAAAGADHAGREFGIVAGVQHGGERQQPHQRHHRADDAGGGGEQRAGDERRDRKRARHAAHRHLQRIKQPVENIRALDHVAHEKEQRHRGQHVVRHHVIGIGDEQIEDTRAHRVVAEEHTHRHQREGDRETQQDDADEAWRVESSRFRDWLTSSRSPHVHFFFNTPAIRRFGQNRGFHFFHIMQPLRPNPVADADDAADDLRQTLHQHEKCRDRDQRLVRIDRRASRAVDAELMNVPDCAA